MIAAYLWEPICPHCGEAASARHALGDAEGPAEPDVGALVCVACAKRVKKGAYTWRLAAVERDDEGTPKPRPRGA